MALTITTVQDPKDLEDFLRLPWTIYKGNPYWVPPLLKEVKEMLDVDFYPFWKHACRELFLARDNGQTLGRIAAIVDDNHNKFHEEKTGFFGFYECVDNFDVSQALYETARKWLKDKSMDRMRGPASPSLNDECAFLLEGFDMPPTIMMPYNPEYYLRQAEKFGMHKVKDLYAFIKYAKDGIPPRIQKMIDRIKARTGVKIRPFNMKEFDRDNQYLKDIYNSAWEKNWGFVPMTEEEIDLATKKLKPFADPDLVLFAELDGKPVGLSVTVPDINQILIKLNGRLGLIEMLKFMYYKNKVTGVRSLIGGVKKEYRESGIIAAIYHETEMANLKHGYEWCELGWNLEDNDLINKFDSAIGGKIYKKYRFYEIDL